MIDLRVAGFAGALAFVACGTNGECSDDSECNSSLNVEFGDYEEWEPGSYTITVERYGACNIEVPRETAAPVCREDNEGISFSGAGSFSIPGDLGPIHVVVEKEGEPFKDIVVSPDYQRPRPECFPSCFVAHEIIE